MYVMEDRTSCESTTECPKNVYTQQHIWCPFVDQLLTAANCGTNLTVVIYNTYTRFANSIRANADDVWNDLVY